MKQLKRSRCAILPLVLEGWWYYMIDSGEKREEYRDDKQYWKIRISNWLNHQKEGWDNISNNKWLVIGFSHGYKKPDMFFLLHRHEVREGAVHPEWGEPETLHYVIKLGERVELVD